MNTIQDILYSNPKIIKSSHYLNRYIKFISSIKSNRNIDTYCEMHHICPSSLFPEYKSLVEYKWNGILLTAREHFIAHWMLARAFNKCMGFAFRMMCVNSTHQSRYQPTSRIYEIAKKHAMSDLNLLKQSDEYNEIKIAAAMKSSITMLTKIVEYNGIDITLGRYCGLKSAETKRSVITTYNGEVMSLADAATLKMVETKKSLIETELGTMSISKYSSLVAADTKMNKNIVYDDQIMSIATMSSIKAAKTKSNTIVEYDGKNINMNQYAAIKGGQTAMTKMVEYNDELISQSKLAGIKASNTRKNTIVEYDGKFITMAEANALKISKTRRERKIGYRSSHPNALRINIYNALGELMFKCHGNFTHTLKENNLPSALAQSYRNNGKPIFIDRKPPKPEFIEYKGWFAIKIDNEVNEQTLSESDQQD